GVRVACARCHNHPFDRWTSDEYYGFAALFGRIDYRVLDNKRKDDLDKHEFVGEQIVYQNRDGEVTNPRTKGPARPRFLGAPTPPPGRTSAPTASAHWPAGSRRRTTRSSRKRR